MEARMTICNMSIEWGAKAGLIAPDQTTFDYLQGRPHAPTGDDVGRGRRLLVVAPDRRRRGLRQGGRHRRERAVAVRHLGDQPGPRRAARRRRACPGRLRDRVRPRRCRARARLHGLDAPVRRCATSPSTPSSSGRAPTAGSRTCAPPLHVIEGRHVADSVRMLVVPGSSRVRLQAEDEGLDVVFKEAGAEWRGAGCSMCLGMNPDQLTPGERSASTSNRNFEGRQGKGGRTHLVSPLVAAATAVVGRLAASGRPCATVRGDRRWTQFTTHTGTARSAARAATSTPTRSSRPCTSSG